MILEKRRNGPTPKAYLILRMLEKVWEVPTATPKVLRRKIGWILSGALINRLIVTTERSNYSQYSILKRLYSVFKIC